jgi:GNAT superfamily N-acetyltransferase
MVRLAQCRRGFLEQLAPLFWRRSKGAVAWTRRYFRFLLLTGRATLLVAVQEGQVIGMACARKVAVPPVYDPGGPTILVDDFAVADQALWEDVGGALLHAVFKAARSNSTAAQVIVVAPVGDEAQSAWLATQELLPVSTWWTKPV